MKRTKPYSEMTEKEKLKFLEEFCRYKDTRTPEQKAFGEKIFGDVVRQIRKAQRGK
jgi:hypothetical protein